MFRGPEHFRHFCAEGAHVRRGALTWPRALAFLIPKYGITRDFDQDSSTAHLLFATTAKNGLPQFQNFINSETRPGDARSTCCRLQLELRERGHCHLPAPAAV